jgi:ribosomal protein S12 methylthiotransferase
VFTYSREENTAAFDFPGQVPQSVKRARRAELMDLQAGIAAKKNRAYLNREVEVLIEGPAPGRATLLRGRTAEQAPEIDGAVFLKGAAEPGEFVRARINRTATYDLHGEVADSAC